MGGKFSRDKHNYARVGVTHDRVANPLDTVAGHIFNLKLFVVKGTICIPDMLACETAFLYVPVRIVIRVKCLAYHIQTVQFVEDV
jgi:hypothetical protein